jgi:hypothetical protein
MILDVFISALLAKGWLEMAVFLSCLCGGFIAVFFTFICKAGVMHATYNSANLPATRRSIKIAVLANFLIVVALVTTIFMSRTPTELFAMNFDSWLSISLSLLGVFLPLLSGALMVAAYNYNWTHRYYSDYQDTKMKLAKFESLRKWIETIVSRLGVTNVNLQAVK